jgi:hypothetical protein
VGITNLPCKKKIIEKLPRNSVGFCGGGQGLSWAVEPRKEERRLYHFLILQNQWKFGNPSILWFYRKRYWKVTKLNMTGNKTLSLKIQQ